MSESDIRAEEALAADEAYDSAFDAPGELDIEAPEADAAEQLRDVAPHEAEPPPEVRDDVDPADAFEQRRVVEYDEDDYR